MKHLPAIKIEIIPHNKQRYDTAGDYLKADSKGWLFRISQMNADAEFLVLIHELIEWYLTQKKDITEQEITDFDIKSGHPDPGILKNAPYHKQHMIAVKMEKMLAKILKIDWKTYDASFDKLR